MKIGALEIQSGAILAPLAGITNFPFRLMVRAAGCPLVYSEMISANGLVQKSWKTFQYLKSNPDEKPVSMQIFGSDPAVMAEAAQIVEFEGADILDINFGCSVRKVVKNGSGAALMREPELARKILTAVRKAIRIPLTIKIRSGWDHSGIQAEKIVKIAGECGVDAVAVHPRTVTQGFKGKADWSLIRSLKQKVSVPIIGNGDITNWQDALAMMEQTGCDAVMIGRAAVGKPFIFSQVAAALDKKPVPETSLNRQFDVMRQYLRTSVQYLGEETAVRMMRSRLGWFSKGLPLAGKFRESLKKLGSEDEALERIDFYQKEVYQFIGHTSHWVAQISVPEFLSAL